MNSLKTVIRRNDFRMKEVADHLEISVVTIDNWDKKKTHPTVTQFDKMCTLLQINFQDTFEEIYK